MIEGIEYWEPKNIKCTSFQTAWVNACKYIFKQNRELRNLIVQIIDINIKDDDIHNKFTAFCKDNNVKTPKDVAYTIFPFGLSRNRTPEKLFELYNKPCGFFDRKKTAWGTYFRRMTHYQGNNNYINQIEKIINAIKGDEKVWNAAFTIIIPQPANDCIRRMNKPCLNYIALQLHKGDPNKLGMLAVYRNHDFLERAYGNYWGLIELLKFISKEIGYTPGPLTCISSRGYINKHCGIFKDFIENLKISDER